MDFHNRGASRRSRSGSSGSADRVQGGAWAPRSRSSENGKHPVPNDRDRCRTVRSSLLEVAVQRAPDFRHEKNRNIHELIEFIQEWGIECPEKYTMQSLQCPTTKIFIGIAKFLIALLMPGHVIGEKHEEEIPFLLKSLGYPYMITRSAVISIAPHSWPQLCHSLVWLSRAITEVPNVTVDASMFLNYTLDVKQNPGQETRFEDEMRASILGSQQKSEESLRKTLNENNRKCEQLESEMGDEEELLKQVDLSEKNNEGMREFFEACNKYLEPKKEKLDQQEASVQKLEALLMEKSGFRETLEAEHEKRSLELTPEERSHMLAQQQKLTDSINSLTLEIEETDEKVWTNEIKRSQCLQEVQELCRKFNSTLNDYMDPSIAGELRLSDRISEKVNSIIEPYLARTCESLLNNTFLRESQDKSKELASKLGIAKVDLDKERRQLQQCQKRGSARLDSCNKRLQENKEVNGALEKELETLSAENDSLKPEGQLTQEKINAATAELALLQDTHKREESSRLAALKAALAEFQEGKQARMTQRHKQLEQLNAMKNELTILKSQYQLLNVMSNDLHSPKR